MIKGQALTDFIAEFTYSNIVEVTETANNTEAVGVGEKWYFIPTEGAMNSGPYMWAAPSTILGQVFA